MEGDNSGYNLVCRCTLFQSTPSVGRATAICHTGNKKRNISIHALRGEGDVSFFQLRFLSLNFNPRPPWGGRQGGFSMRRDRCRISIHALRGEGDTIRACPLCSRHGFQSTPSVGRATGKTTERGGGNEDFNPRPPWGGRRCCRAPARSA